MAGFRIVNLVQVGQAQRLAIEFDIDIVAVAVKQLTLDVTLSRECVVGARTRGPRSLRTRRLRALAQLCLGRCLGFKPAFPWIMVRQQTQENRRSQAPIARPVGISDSRHQFRLYPESFLPRVWTLVKWKMLGPQRLHRLKNLFSILLIKPGSHTADVEQLAVTVKAEQKRAKVRPAASWSCVASHHGVEFLDRLELLPLVGALPGVWAPDLFCDNALKPFLFGQVEEFLSFLNLMVRIHERRSEFKSFAQQPFAITKRRAPEIITVTVKQIKNAVGDRRLFHERWRRVANVHP